MKKLIGIIILLLAGRAYADDTAQLQAMINAGDVVLPANHAPYTITSISLVHSLNLNGNVIQCTRTDDFAIQMSSPGVKLSNGELVGVDNSTNPSGVMGVVINADNDEVSGMYIHKFSSYGILGGDGNSPVITKNKITDIGYMGVFFASNKHSIKGGIVSFNTIDRSSIDPATTTEGALKIRGTEKYSSAGWRVHDNILVMPIAPKDWNLECFELRYAPYSLIYNNTCIGGSIGISIVRNDFVRTYNNKCTKQNHEGIEYADSGHGMIRDNIITDQLGMGMLVDGFAPRGCKQDTLINNTISKCKGFGIQLFKDTEDTYLKNCRISTGSKAVNIQGAHGVTLEDCDLIGSGYGSTGLFLDNTAGKVTMRRGSMKGFEHKLYIYATKPVTTDDVLLDGVKSINNIKEADKSLTGGASVGGNIRIR